MLNLAKGFDIPCLSSNCFFTRPSSSSAHSRHYFSPDTSALWAAVVTADACFQTKGYTSLTESPAKRMIWCPVRLSLFHWTVHQGLLLILWQSSIHTSKPFIRLRQDSFSPLSADWIFSITAPMRARCSLTMDALFSAVDRIKQSILIIYSHNSVSCET